MEQCKQQMLSWVNRFNICCFLDSHHYTSPHSSAECIAGAGAVDTCCTAEKQLDAFKAFSAGKQDWLFGHVSYNLKGETGYTASPHPDRVGFPDLFFFRPETVLILKQGGLTIETLLDPCEVFKQVQAEIMLPAPGAEPCAVQARMTRNDYIDAVEKIRAHILRGDCYELNYCQEFFADDAHIDPLEIYRRLAAISPNPFSCLYKLDDKWVLCASPERYLQKKGRRLISQPIKGTWKRDIADPAADAANRERLAKSEKDKSENVMVVDLVRNDLSRVCRKGSVTADELFGIYSFPQVHQMVSTISGELDEGVDLADILRASFPMGSMTGAPKKRVLELIDQYERSARGLYSGAIGYISPEEDFDFNVVIRSILYNASAHYLSYMVGGGITFYSDAAKEYEECLLKAQAIERVLAGS